MTTITDFGVCTAPQSCHAERPQALLRCPRSALYHLQLLPSTSLLGTAHHRDLLLKLLDEVRRRHRFVVLGYVVMPEHFHLLISEPQETTPSVVMQVLKQRFAHQVLRRSRLAQRNGQGSLWAKTAGPDAAGEIWQRRFYDFNVWRERKRIEKLRYMHRNPVKPGLVSQPEHWAWSSFRAYAFGEPGAVRINDCQVLQMRVRPAAAAEKGVHTHPFAKNAKG